MGQTVLFNCSFNEICRPGVLTVVLGLNSDECQFGFVLGIHCCSDVQLCLPQFVCLTQETCQMRERHRFNASIFLSPNTLYDLSSGVNYKSLKWWVFRKVVGGRGDECSYLENVLLAVSCMHTINFVTNINLHTILFFILFNFAAVMLSIASEFFITCLPICLQFASPTFRQSHCWFSAGEIIQSGIDKINRYPTTGNTTNSEPYSTCSGWTVFQSRNQWPSDRY